MNAPKLDPWIETYTGVKFNFLEPTPDMVQIEDIAHSLSHQCRFSGHTKVFYSVAEHSIRVAQNSGERFFLTGLLHDASEAYIHDIPSPVKPYLTNYHELEEGIMKAVAAKFGIVWPLPDIVKDADRMCLKAEARGLLPSKGKDWVHQFPTLTEIDDIVPGGVHSSRAAKMLFLHLFHRIREHHYEAI